MSHNPKIEMVLADPCASYWLKDALRAALKRDPVDAYRDARLLVELLASAPEQAHLEAARHRPPPRVGDHAAERNAAEWLDRLVLR